MIEEGRFELKERYAICDLEPLRSVSFRNSRKEFVRNHLLYQPASEDRPVDNRQVSSFGQQSGLRRQHSPLKARESSLPSCSPCYQLLVRRLVARFDKRSSSQSRNSPLPRIQSQCWQVR